MNPINIMPEDALTSSVVDALKSGTKIRTASGFAFRAIPCGSKTGAYKFGCTPMVIGKTYWYSSARGALKALAKL